MSYSCHLDPETVTIFLLHGVEDGVETQVRNYTRKHLPRDYFAGFLRDLTRHGTPVSMDAIVAAHQGGTALPPKAFAITFDDGFENNLSVAAPILDEMGVPATFYVTSDFIDRNRMSWMDRIEFAVEQKPTGRLALPWGERRFASVEDRKALLDDIRLNVKSTADLDPEAVASDIQVQLGFDETWSSDHPLDRKLTWAELRRLAEPELFTIGGHSHTHPILAFLDDAALAFEIDRSLALLRDRAGLVVQHYSYPEGLAHCYDDRVIALLKDRGIVCSPSAIEGRNTPDIDLFNLRRIMVV